jgi:hypothetical protein
MASVQSEDLKTLYKGWVAALAANPSMELDQMRRMFEHWGDVTAEPGGVDYVEVTAGGVPALWATPKGLRRTACSCAPMVAAMSPARCTRIARCTAISPRRSAAAR